jgi:hypothetical protein
MEVRPFTIHVPDDVLEDLRWRLRHTRFPDAIPGSGWDYGSNLEYLKAPPQVSNRYVHAIRGFRSNCSKNTQRNNLYYDGIDRIDGGQPSCWIGGNMARISTLSGDSEG